MNPPVVSVLMTTYNREKYVGEAIESVLASTFTDFELVIVDDRSSDNTPKIINDYATRDKRIRVFSNEKNLGDYPNRNQAAKYATGKYLKYVDADDFIYPWGLELLVGMMERFPDAGWGLCTLPMHDESPYPMVLSPASAYRYHYSGGGIFFRSPLSAIIKRKAFWDVGGFQPLRMVGDFDMWHRLGQVFPVVLMPDGIIWNRIHPEQEMSSQVCFVSEYEKIKIKYLTAEDCPLNGEAASAILRGQRGGICKALSKALLFFRFDKARVQMRRLSPYLNIQKFRHGDHNR